jgi:hypothetical protein
MTQYVIQDPIDCAPQYHINIGGSLVTQFSELHIDVWYDSQGIAHYVEHGMLEDEFNAVLAAARVQATKRAMNEIGIGDCTASTAEAYMSGTDWYSDNEAW